MEFDNPISRLLAKKRRPLVGIIQSSISDMLAETCRRTDLDFLFIDLEHGSFSEEEVAQTIMAGRAAEVMTVVRLKCHDRATMLHYAAIGAEAVALPNVANATQAEEIAVALGGNQRTAFIAILESAAAVRNAEEIIAVKGVDAVIIGPYDLSADLGLGYDFGDPRFAKAFGKIESACMGAGKTIGTVPHGDITPGMLIDRGFQILILGSEQSLLSDGITHALQEIRAV